MPKIKYHFLTFEHKAVKDRSAIKLIKPLEKICEKFGGHRLFTEHGYTSDMKNYLRWEENYLVGSCLVKNDTGSEERRTVIMYAEALTKKFDYPALIKAFEEFYRKGRVKNIKVTHNIMAYNAPKEIISLLGE